MAKRISIQCDCSRVCSIDLGNSSQEFLCPACGKKLFKFAVTVGQVYVLSNPAMPGLLKIGATERSVQERVVELNGTGVPVPFEIEAVFDSANPLRDEQKVHQFLGENRLNSNREFFSLDLRTAVQRVIDCLNIYPSYLKNPDIVKKDFVGATTKKFDPVLHSFSLIDNALVDWQPETKNEAAPATDEQVTRLDRHGFDTTGWKSGYAQKVLDVMDWRFDQNLATPRQVRCLLNNGYPDAQTMTRMEANATMDELSREYEKNRKNRKR
ncbi:GIY-YIG nuclease family protein [Pontiellaceae bacterium B1224]|nr:GIY-YIG nuclease family protein [Pontiellaceae bacterium B1224]